MSEEKKISEKNLLRYCFHANNNSKYREIEEILNISIQEIWDKLKEKAINIEYFSKI